MAGLGVGLGAFLTLVYTPSVCLLYTSRGRSYSERKWLCRFEEIFVGMLILERVYNDKEKSKTNTEYIFMVFTYCSTGKCFCAAVLQEAR